MPILYKNTNEMKKWNEVIQSELDAMEKHHKLTGYSDADIAELVNLVRIYVDKHVSGCITCKNSLREAKDKLNGFYATWKDKIQDNIDNPPVVESDLEKATRETNDYTEEDEK